MNYSQAMEELKRNMILNQTKLAKTLGVAFQSVNRWEKNVHEPTSKIERKL